MSFAYGFNEIMFKQAWDLATFKAFRPLLFDVKVGLGDRLDGHSVIGVIVQADSLILAKIDVNAGDFQIAQCETVVVDQEVDRIAAITSFSSKHGLSLVMLLSSPEFEAVKIDRALSSQGVDRLLALKQATFELFGESQEAGRVFAYVTNPQAEETLKFSYKQEVIDNWATLLNQAGLSLVRMTCGIYATVEYLMCKNQILAEDQILFIYSSNALLITSIDKGRFNHTGFRANISFKDLEQIVPRMMERFDCTYNQMTYVNCSDWDLDVFFKNNYPDLKLKAAFEDCRKGAFLAACHG